MLLGAHCSTQGGAFRALERALAVGADSCQIFVKNNMRWLGKSFEIAAVKRFEQDRRTSRIAKVFGHTGYLINIAAPPGPNRDKSIHSLIHEVQLATTLGLPFLVLHPGAHLGAGEELGLERAAAALDTVFAATPNSKVRIALENTAGQGTCLGAKISHLAQIIRQVRLRARVGICLDTAHFFAAGYDIRTGKGWNAAIKEVSDLVGLKRVLAFHLNDSKTALGSRVDRHAHIGQGFIGSKGFRHILNDPRFLSHPACIETPKSDDLHEDIENLRVLRSLIHQRLQNKGPNRKVRQTCDRETRPRRT